MFGICIISSFFVGDMKIDFLLNVMMLIEIGHCRGVHDFILCRECGYINHLSDGLLNVLFLMDYLGRKNNLFLS